MQIITQGAISEQRFVFCIGCDCNNEEHLQKQTRFFTIEILRLLNSNAKSILPVTALKCIISWLKCFSPEHNDHHDHNEDGAIANRGASNVGRR